MISVGRLCRGVVAMWCVGGAVFAAAPLPIYQPRVKMADIYFHHPGAKPALKYNHDETLFCAWCDYNARKTYIATSTDGVRWHNREVPTAPPSLAGQVVGFPTNHGLLTSQGVMMFPCSLAEIEEKFQPQGGTAFYPNGFVDHGKLYVAYTYPAGIHSSVIEPLPDFTRPFLLPREGRPGLKIENGMAHFGQRQSSLGLVLTEKLTRQPKLRLAFDVNVNRYSGGDWPVLTLGGKTRSGTVIRAVYDEQRKADFFQVRSVVGNEWADLASFKMKEWNHIEVELTEIGLSVAVNKAPAVSFEKPILRKICFGGLYVAPEWPIGMSHSSDVRLKLDSIVVE